MSRVAVVSWLLIMLGVLSIAQGSPSLRLLGQVLWFFGLGIQYYLGGRSMIERMIGRSDPVPVPAENSDRWQGGAPA